MKIFVESERLILREILPTDIDGLYRLDSDPEVHRYLGNKPVTDKDQIVEIVEIINFIRQQYIDNGIGRWAIIDKKTKNFIGWTGLKFVTELTNNHKNYYDLGYRLIKEYWGQGIATENEGSNKILKKVGLEFIEKFDLDGIEHNWYKIERKEHENKKPNR